MKIEQIYPFLLLLFISPSNSNFHAQLYRVIPPQNIFPRELDINLKGLQPTGKSTNSVISIFDTDLKGIINYGYYMSVGIGTPPQNFNLIIDTGSSNTAVAGSSHEYLSNYFRTNQSTSFIDYNIQLKVPYDSGEWNGIMGSDIFTFDGVPFVDPGRKLKYSKSVNVRSNIGIIKNSKTFFVKEGNFHGILGLAYPVLAQPSSINPKSTLFDDIVRKYSLTNMFSVVLCGHEKINASAMTSGYFIVGGENKNLYDPPMVDILIYRQWFYDVIISRISISNKPIILSSCKEYNQDKTILDTGTTDTYFPRTVFHSLVSSILYSMQKTPFDLNNNSPFWERKAVVCVINSVGNHPAIFFPEILFELVINDTASLELILSPQQYIQYAGDQMDYFGVRRNCYKFGFGMSKSGTILGNSFLEGFYLLFNRDQGKVGIAQSRCNVHVPTMMRSRILSINKGQQGLLACSGSTALSTSLINWLTPTMTIIIGILLTLVLIPIIILVIYRRNTASSDQERSNLIESNQPNQTQPYYESVK